MIPNDEREARIRALFPLVRALARRVARMVAGADRDDLVGDGSIGLIRAVDTFDATRGVALERYAQRIIVGAMLNGIRRRDPVSERVRRELRAADRERFSLAHERGALPTLAEMEQRRPKLRRARSAARCCTPLSIDAPLPTGEGTIPHFGDDGAADPLQTVIRAAALRDLNAALALLSRRQRRVIALHYFGDVPLRRVSAELAVSPQRASQLHLDALRRLRGTLERSEAAR